MRGLFLVLSISVLSATVENQAGAAHASPSSGQPAQEVRIALRGMVVDNAGAAWPNLTVEIRSVTPMQPNASTPIAARTDKDGQFSVDVVPGSYKVCVARFRNSCHEILVEAGKAPEYLHLQLGTDYEHVTEEQFDSRTRELAGPGAKDCGHVLRTDDPKDATRCAYRAFKQRRAFYVRYDDKGVGDSIGAQALASDSTGKVYSVGFDSMALDLSVTPCSQPPRLRVSRTSGELICFAGDRWLGDK